LNADIDPARSDTKNQQENKLVRRQVLEVWALLYLVVEAWALLVVEAGGKAHRDSMSLQRMRIPPIRRGGGRTLGRRQDSRAAAGWL
jgi:hypothetical protein